MIADTRLVTIRVLEQEKSICDFLFKVNKESSRFQEGENSTMRDRKKHWVGKWIEPYQFSITNEPVFTIEEMIAGDIPPQKAVEDRLHPCQMLKREFEADLSKQVSKATLSMTAHGIYLAKINGIPVSDALFTPDYTSYNHYLQYQVYDITDLLKDRNIWSVTVADGWYGGRVSINGGSAQFGNRLGILGEIEITYSDGSISIIGTDENFVSSTGKYIYSDIFIGEKQDLRKEVKGWETTLEGKNLHSVIVAKYPMDNLIVQQAEYVKEMETLIPQSIWEESDSYIVDFGQVIAGRVRLELFLAEDQELLIEHSETLDENGLFLNNVSGRNKEQQDRFIGRGRKEILEPTFTFHGFRYVKLTGLQRELSKKSIVAVVLYTAMKKTGSLLTDNDKVNQLLNNIEWSQKGNMLSIPTDCPQRERLGWTGDMQIYAPTATFFMDIYNFSKRWLDNVRAEQLENGEIVDYSPAPSDFFTTPSFTGTISSAGWGDAIIMVPWTLYQRYGNLEILEENYEAMVKWHEFSKASAAGNKKDHKKYLWDTKFHYGDWLFPSYVIGENSKGALATSNVTKDIFATAFLANSSLQLAEISEVLGEQESAMEYRTYASYVKAAFEAEYFKDGRFTQDFQGCYVIAIAFDMLSEKARNQAVQKLVELITNNNYRLDTGFLSVPYLLDVLVDNHQEEVARKVFLQEECPSWLYEINQGATTIWESWANIALDGKVGERSFNHYAFGCVGDWMVRRIAGLQVKKPGFKEFYVSPSLEFGVKDFILEYESASGIIKVSVKDDVLEVHVPKDTTAFIRLAGNSSSNEKVVSAGKYRFELGREAVPGLEPTIIF